MELTAMAVAFVDAKRSASSASAKSIHFLYKHLQTQAEYDLENVCLLLQ